MEYVSTTHRKTMSSKSFEQLRLVYILYTVGAFFGPLMFVGVILAYIERGKITDLSLENHVEKQIRIFWIWLIALVVLTVYVGCGAVVLPAIFELFAGSSVVALFVGFGILVVLPLLVALGLSLYVLISSIVSLKSLGRRELT